MVEAKAIAVELLEDLTVLADMLVKNAKRTGTQVPNREAFCHLIERVHVLLDASHETTNKLLQDASDVTKSEQNLILDTPRNWSVALMLTQILRDSCQVT
jgi:hypothetical protein